LVTGTIYTSTTPIVDAGATALAVAAAALNAYSGPGGISPARRPGGLDVALAANNKVPCVGLCTPGDLGGRTLRPGIYYSNAAGASASYQIIGANDLILDARATRMRYGSFRWIPRFVVSAPTGPLVTVARTVQLIGGAQAKNVFWYVPAGAVINTGSNMVGTIISTASTTLGTSDVRVSPIPASGITRLNGRVLVLGAQATMVNTRITGAVRLEATKQWPAESSLPVFMPESRRQQFPKPHGEKHEISKSSGTLGLVAFAGHRRPICSGAGVRLVRRAQRWPIKGEN